MTWSQGSLGGGVIQTTASESTFVCLLAGRTEAIKKYQVRPTQPAFVMVI